jgi:glutamate 5-kinase
VDQGSLKSAGSLVVDDGAVRALSSGKSLLPAGSLRSTASSSAVTWST